MSADLLPYPADDPSPLRLYTGPPPDPDPPLAGHPERTRRDDDPLDAVLELSPELLPALDEPGTEEAATAWGLIAEAMRERRPKLYGGRPTPPPTDALPGTPEKIEVMRARVAAGLAPCAPSDRTCERAQAVGLKAGAGPKNGAGAKLCLSGTDRRAAATTGRQAGGEREIRVRLDEARAARKAERKAAREAAKKAG